MLLIILQTMSKLVSHLFLILTVINFISIITLYFHFHPVHHNGVPQSSGATIKSSNKILIKLVPNRTEIVGFWQKFQHHRIATFLGIPYAEPPIGKLRFQPPKSLNKQKIIASKWPNPCLQANDPKNRLRLMNQNFSEDCLYLNIWSPVRLNPKESESSKPVLVLFHTGAFLFGSASEQTYNGVALAAMADLVVVTFNYRLNFYGFFYDGNEHQNGRVTPNVGLLDQTEALRWIQSNIAQFGGDPNRMTLLGQASGALSAGLHLTLSLKNQGPIRQAILMSDSPLQTPELSKPQHVAQFWLNYAKELNCSVEDKNTKNRSTTTIDCIESRLENGDRQLLPTMEMVKRLSYDSLFVNVPIVEDRIFGGIGDEINQTTESFPISLLFGYTDDEGSWIASMDDPKQFGPKSIPSVETLAEAEQLIRSFLTKMSTPADRPLNVTQILEHYLDRLYKIQTESETETEIRRYSSQEEEEKEDSVGDKNQLLNPKLNSLILTRLVSSVLGDFYIKCPAIRFAGKILESNIQNSVYQYRWNYKGNFRTSPFWNTFSEVWCGEWMGSCHSFEMYAVFGNPFLMTEVFDEQDRIVSSKAIQMVKYFTHNEGKLFWPKFSSTEKWFYSIDSSIEENGPTFGKNLDQEVCHDVWN